MVKIHLQDKIQNLSNEEGIKDKVEDGKIFGNQIEKNHLNVENTIRKNPNNVRQKNKLKTKKKTIR